ncbi:MAG: hypothetical protein ACLUEQ_01695 [Cloacibacillus evryensis]
MKRGASVLRDGVVVDYQGRLAVVRRLKGELEGGSAPSSASARSRCPPGPRSSARTHRYIAEGAGFEVTEI